MTNKTLYDQEKAAWDKIAASGRPNVAIAARYFTTYPDMERVLGLCPSTVKKWVVGRNNVSRNSEVIARMWLDNKVRDLPPEPAQPQSSGVLLVVVPDGSTDKVKRVLVMLGCEIEDV